MRLIDAHARLREMPVPWFSTASAAGWLGISNSTASTVLGRLRRSGHVVRLERGRWADPQRMTPDALPMALSAPDPSYISLYSALYRHGMIEQVPGRTYAMTLASTRMVTTPLGAVSLHQASPAYYAQNSTVELSPFVRIATPEQALVDTIYLRPARSGLFRSLPELSIPRRFSKSRLRQAVCGIRSPSRRSFVSAELEREMARSRAESA